MGKKKVRTYDSLSVEVAAAVGNERPSPSGRRTYVSLFSSAGVGCYGFKEQGFECIATNELLPQRLRVQRANCKCKYDSGYIGGDITQQAVKDRIREEIAFWRDFEHIDDVDVVFATPPCQGMSSVNYKKSDHEQVRNSLVVEAIKVIRDIRPKVFVFENVRAFLTTICTDLSGEDVTIRESIWRNLGKDYHIYAKVINFKDYGVPSSRPRTLVIGTRKTLINLSPLNLFPARQREITLREAIGDMPALGFGEKDAADFLHFARPFPEYMVRWIENLREGKSAFEQDDESCRPYKEVDGKRVPLKGAYIGNKYRRLVWDRPGACIATRNDQLASQDTIHPRDNRVLSIRELMRLMTIPDTFVWTVEDAAMLPAYSDSYLKAHELNIRRCIGEAVPTAIISQIASNVRQLLDFDDFVASYRDGAAQALLDSGAADSNFYIYTFLHEQLLVDCKESGSFYTPQSVVFDAIKDLPAKSGVVSILEPAVGMGAFLPQLCRLYSDVDAVNIDAVEISPSTIATLQAALGLIALGENVKINFICADFLKYRPTHSYDVVATNPPYAKATEKYADIKGATHRTSNLFALFMVKLRDLADDIACIIPKNFILADEYASVRNLYASLPIVSIADFGVRFFKKVFVEIISIHFSKSYDGLLTVTNYVDSSTYHHPQGYIYHDRLWLIYRSEWFDRYIAGLTLDAFDVFRDRQITNPMLKSNGKFWVIKSKNILDDGEVVHRDGYDRYIDTISQIAVGKYLNSRAIIMPSFTYNTRATLLPDGCIPNGSVAVLIPKRVVEPLDLRVYSTDDFRHYYAIVKSYSKFTLNIDNSSVYYIGTPNG